MRNIVFYFIMTFMIAVNTSAVLANMNIEETLTGTCESLEGMSSCELDGGHFTPFFTAHIGESDNVSSEDIDTDDRGGNEDRGGSGNTDTENGIGNEHRGCSEDIDTEDMVSNEDRVGSEDEGH